MKYKQIIQNFKEDYKKEKEWSIIETDHYIFHYFKKYTSSLSVKKVAVIQEKSYAKILSFLSISDLNIKINYYIYPDEESKTRLMGNGTFGQSVYKDFSIHIVYNKKIKPVGSHEDTHLLSIKYGLATSFFAEGLAEVVDFNSVFMSKSRKYWLKKWIKKYNIENVSKFFTQDGWIDSPDDESAEFYTISMLFVKFLIDRFGIKSFLDFYKSINRGMSEEEIIDKLEKVYNIKYFLLICEWKNFLSNFLVIK